MYKVYNELYRNNSRDFVIYTTEKNAKIAILKFAIIYFFTQDCYKVVPFQ